MPEDSISDRGGSRLRQVFLQEYQHLKGNPVPAFEICFYPYCGLTNTVRLRNGQIKLRLSDVLREAPDGILRSIVAVLLHKLFRFKVPEDKRTRYRQYVNQSQVRLRLGQIRRTRGSKRLDSPVGKVFDLRHVFRELNKTYFDDKVRIRHLSWSVRKNRTTLGHFDLAHRAILIDLRLDNPLVPHYVISYVIYHEMLHAFFGEEVRGGFRRIHHERFRLAERRFADYLKAKTFIRRHLC